jgi:hypothetical protein
MTRNMGWNVRRSFVRRETYKSNFNLDLYMYPTNEMKKMDPGADGPAFEVDVMFAGYATGSGICATEQGALEKAKAEADKI